MGLSRQTLDGVDPLGRFAARASAATYRDARGDDDRHTSAETPQPPSPAAASPRMRLTRTVHLHVPPPRCGPSPSRDGAAQTMVRVVASWTFLRSLSNPLPLVGAATARDRAPVCVAA